MAQWEWDNMVPGLFKAGVGLYGAKKSEDLADKNLNTVQSAVDSRRNLYMSAGLGDLYNRLVAGTTKQLDLAGSMDPQVLASQELEKRLKLLEPERKRADARLFAELQKKGLLGMGTYGQPGAEPGAATNPMMGGLKAAQAHEDAKLAADAMNYGESYLDRLLKRGQGMFQTASSVDSMLNNRQDSNAVIAATQARDKAKNAGTQGLVQSAPGMFGTLWKGIGGLEGVKDIGRSASNIFSSFTDSFKAPPSGYMSNLDLGGWGDMAPSSDYGADYDSWW